MKYLMSFFLYLYLGAQLYSDTSPLELKEAQLLYEKALELQNDEAEQKLMRAKNIYKKALNTDSNKAYLHYNLGTVYLKLKDYGPSIFHLQQAYALNNNDKKIVGNLQRAKLLAGLQGVEDESKELNDFLTTIWTEINPKLLQSLAILTAVLFSAWMFLKGLGPAASHLWISIVLCSVLLYLAYAHSNGLWIDQTTILLTSENPRSGLGSSYPGLLKDDTLKPGSSGKLVREEQGWVEVHWRQGIRGWVKKEKVGILQ